MLEERDKYLEIREENGVLTLTPTGDIDHHWAGELREIADREVYAHRPREVVLDLSRVAFMDSAGLGFILGRCRCAGMADASFCIKDPTPQIERILELAGTEKIITVRRSKPAAEKEKQNI